MAIDTENNEQQLSQEDVAALRKITPPRKSVLNFSNADVDDTSAFAVKFQHEIGDKSPYQRRLEDWREAENTPVAVVGVAEHDTQNYKTHKKDGTIPRGTFMNRDTGYEIVVGMRGLDDTYSHAKTDEKRNYTNATLNAIYHLKELTESAVFLDTQTIDEKNNNSPNALFMHRLYTPFIHKGEPYVARISVEEDFKTNKNDEFEKTHHRFYNLKGIKTVPLIGILSLETQLSGVFSPRADTSNTATISIAQLFAIVKEFDKNFYLNPTAPGRPERIAEIQDTEERKGNTMEEATLTYSGESTPSLTEEHKRLLLEQQDLWHAREVATSGADARHAAYNWQVIRYAQSHIEGGWVMPEDITVLNAALAGRDVIEVLDKAGIPYNHIVYADFSDVDERGEVNMDGISFYTTNISNNSIPTFYNNHIDAVNAYYDMYIELGIQDNRALGYVIDGQDKEGHIYIKRDDYIDRIVGKDSFPMDNSDPRYEDFLRMLEEVEMTLSSLTLQEKLTSAELRAVEWEAKAELYRARKSGAELWPIISKFSAISRDLNIGYGTANYCKTPEDAEHAEQNAKRIQDAIASISGGVGTNFDMDVINAAVADRDVLDIGVAVARDEITHREGMTPDEPKASNVTQDADKVSAKDKLTEQLTNGIKGIMDSEEFKNYLNTCSHLAGNNYSMRNTLLVYLQKPDASHVMGYDAWKQCGRTVKQGATSAKIFIPVMAKESSKGTLATTIRRELKSQLDGDSSVSQATYYLGASNHAFTMNRANGLMGVKVNGVEKGVFNSDSQFRQYIDNAILGKVPMYYNVASVFDAKDVVIPEHLWVKSGYSKADVVNDEKGKPVKNKKGEVKIVNTPERQARFVSSLDMTVAAQDPEKMERLFNAATEVCRNRGVAVFLRDKESDERLKDGADGYYARSAKGDGHPYDAETAKDMPNGCIVLDESMDITEKNSVLIHEMAHSDLHKDIDALAAELGEDKITKSMRETQAEAVSYVVANHFGIESAQSSFAYIAEYTRGFELQDMQKSLDVIHREIKSLFNDIKAELDKAGFNLDLTEKPKAPLESEKVSNITADALNFAFEEEKNISCDTALLTGYISQYKDSPIMKDALKELKTNINVRQSDIDLIKSAVDKLNEPGITREIQDEATENINAALKRIDIHVDESVVIYDRIQEEQYGPESTYGFNFDKDPAGTLATMCNMVTDHESCASAFPRLKTLDDNQLTYIATSKYIANNLASLVNSDPHAFVNRACDRAEQFGNVAAKNGTFVEFNSVDNWFYKPIVDDGALCHPKIAEKIFTQAETQVSGMRAAAEQSSEGYVPAVNCDITVYSLVNGELTALNTVMDIGDGSQKSLSEHLGMVAEGQESEPLICAVNGNFQTAIHEHGPYKSKIYLPDADISSQDGNTRAADPQGHEPLAVAHENAGRAMSMGDWKEKIGEAKQEAEKASGEGQAADKSKNTGKGDKKSAPGNRE